MNRFRRAAREAVLIIVLGVAAGLAFNFPLLKKWAGGEFARAFISKDEYPGIRMISRAEAEDLFFGGGALFVDSRSRRTRFSVASAGERVGLVVVATEAALRGAT